MDAPPLDFSPVRYSTDDLPERDRIAAWREFIGPRIFSAEIQPIVDAPFRAEVTVRLLPGIALMSATSSPARYSRNARLLADGRDDFGLQVNSAAHGTVVQHGEETTYEPGDAVLVSATVAGANVSPHPSRYRLLFVRPEDLAPLVPGIEDALLRRVPANTEALQYLLSYTRFLEGERGLADPELAHAAATHLRDLFALALGASRDAVFIAEGRGLRAARLQAIKRHVVDHLGDVRLSVNEVAARHHVTPRYVQRLFEREGTTFSEYVLNQRLARVREMLGDPRCADWGVSMIALAAGFGDISYFNRRFRRRYGASPTEIRHSFARR
jgi:AraC-like DNA-binding protein